MADKDPTIPFYAQDFLVDTIQLPEHLVGAYIRLLCVLWINKFCYNFATPLAMISPSAKEVVELLKDKFTFYPDNTFTSNRLEEVRAKRVEIRLKRQEAGYLGGKNKWQNDSKDDSKKIAKVTVIETETVTDIVKKWNDFAERKGLAKVVKLTDKRIKKLEKRLADENFNFDHIIIRISESDFLLGKTKDWKVDFDFIIENETNFIKILEGKYNGTAKPDGIYAKYLTQDKLRRIAEDIANDPDLRQQ